MGGTNNASGLTATDLDGNPRIADDNGDYEAVVDMGTFEGAFESPCTPEIKHDGIDQDCNGEASYDAHKDKLYVEATSSLEAQANLALSGYGQMTWVTNKSRWVITVKTAGGNPGAVTVSGAEGSETVPVVVN